MKARLKDLDVKDCFIWMNTECVIQSKVGMIKFKPVSKTCWHSFEFGINCMMWVELIENESKKAA